MILKESMMLIITKDDKFHYVLIKDLNKLLFNQNKNGHRKYYCERCLHGYVRKDLLEKHKPDCKGIGNTAVKVEMPEEGNNKLQFQNYHKQMKVPYVIYADFEALTSKLEGPERERKNSNTHNTHFMKVCSYCYIVVRCDGKTSSPEVYRGPNASEHLLKKLQEEEMKIKKELANPEPMIFTEEDAVKHKNATMCHVCEKPLNGDSVRDHDHITGKYRGPAHNECNLKLRLNPKTTTIPVVFHNLRGYDSHLLMQAISKVKVRLHVFQTIQKSIFHSHWDNLDSLIVFSFY